MSTSTDGIIKVMATPPSTWMKEHEKSDQKAFQAIHDHMDRLDKATNNDLIIYKIDELKEQFIGLEVKLESNFITKTEFEPIKKLVYGVVALILMGVVGGILALVIKGGV